MIRLSEIKKAENKIYCAAYFEDSPQPVSLTYDIDERAFLPFDFPAGYEWCKTHVAHAARHLEDLATAAVIPTEKTIMWY